MCATTYESHGSVGLKLPVLILEQTHIRAATQHQPRTRTMTTRYINKFGLFKMRDTVEQFTVYTVKIQQMYKKKKRKNKNL